MRALPLLLAALLVVPAAAVAAPDGPRSPSSSPGAGTFATSATQADGIAVLTVGPPSRASIANGSLDVGTSLALDRARTEIRIEQYAFEARLNGSGSDAAVVEAALSEIANRSGALRRSERALWRGYANGSIGETAFLRGLAETYVRAKALDRWQSAIASEFDRPLLQNPTLTALTGPVRSRVAAAIRGKSTGNVYLESSPDGIVLATIADGRYLRATYRADRQSVPPQPLLVDSIRELPALSSQYGLSTIPGIQGLNDNTFYRYEWGFDGGSITAYLDGGTESIFYEVQTRRLTALSGRPVRTATANGTRLLVNRSYPGGPLRVATYDNATGIPISTTVVVGDHRIETGSDGVAWTLTPPGSRFEVTAIGIEGRVSATVRPIQPTPLGS